MLLFLKRLLGIKPNLAKNQDFHVETWWNDDPVPIAGGFESNLMLGEKKIGLARGHFQPNGRFIVVKIEVDSNLRGKGYGTQAISTLRQAARERHCTAFVFHGVSTTNTRAIALYTRMQATPIATSANIADYVITPP